MAGKTTTTVWAYGETERAQFTAFGDTEAEVRADLIRRAEEFFGGHVVLVSWDGRKPTWYFHVVDAHLKANAAGKKLYASMYAQRADGGDAITVPQPPPAAVRETRLEGHVDSAEHWLRQADAHTTFPDPMRTEMLQLAAIHASLAAALATAGRA